MSVNSAVQRRDEIVSAAEKVFDARGFAATTMDAVAEEAGIAKGSLYNYFKSKQDLFLGVFTRVMARNEADAQQRLAEGESATYKLQSLLDLWIGRLEEHKRVGRLLLEFWATAAREDRQGELAKAFAAIYARWRDLLSGILDQGIAAGEFKAEYDSPVGASLIMAVLDGIVVQLIMDAGLEASEQLWAALKRAILIALRAEGQAAPPQGQQGGRD